MFKDSLSGPSTSLSAGMSFVELSVASSAQARSFNFNFKKYPILKLGQSEIKKLAWIGDSVHTLDIKLIVLAARTTEKELSVRMQRYISGKSQSDYLEKNYPDMLPYNWLKEHTKSSIFEAMYKTTFRIMYLQSVIREDQRPELTRSLKLLSEISLLPEPDAYLGTMDLSTRSLLNAARSDTNLLTGSAAYSIAGSKPPMDAYFINAINEAAKDLNVSEEEPTLDPAEIPDAIMSASIIDNPVDEGDELPFYSSDDGSDRESTIEYAFEEGAPLNKSRVVKPGASFKVNYEEYGYLEFTMSPKFVSIMESIKQLVFSLDGIVGHMTLLGPDLTRKQGEVENFIARYVYESNYWIRNLKDQDVHLDEGIDLYSLESLSNAITKLTRFSSLDNFTLNFGKRKNIDSMTGFKKLIKDEVLDKSGEEIVFKGRSNIKHSPTIDPVD